MNEIETLLANIEKQKTIVDEKKAKVELIKSESSKKIEELEERVKKAYDVWQGLAWSVPKAKEDRSKAIREVGYNESYLKVYNKIKKLSKQIVISNDMLVELLKQETGDNWTINLMQYIEQYKGDMLFHNQTKLGLWVMRNASPEERSNLKEISKIVDVDTKKEISLESLKDKDIQIIASTTSSMDDDKKHLREMNWAMPYFIKKYLGENRRPNYELNYNEDIYDDYIGTLMYSAIDKYVTNLLASEQVDAKKPIVKK